MKTIWRVYQYAKGEAHGREFGIDYVSFAAAKRAAVAYRRYFGETNVYRVRKVVRHAA